MKNILLKKVSRRLLGHQNVSPISESLKQDPFKVQKIVLPYEDVEIIFDVGAHEGLITKKYREIFPKSRVYSFEPYLPSYQRLQKKFSDDPLVLPQNIAVDSESGQSSLNVNSSVLTNSLLESDDKGSFHWRKGLLETNQKIIVDVSTIDSFCLREEVSHINILKLDIQGKEYAALKGAQRLMTSHSIDLIYCEVILVKTYKEQPKLLEILELAEKYGYTLFGVYNLCCKSVRLNQVDIVFVSNTALSKYENTLLE